MLKITVFRRSRRIGCQLYYLRAQYSTDVSPLIRDRFVAKLSWSPISMSKTV
jgi:hypothetical protein